MLTYELVDSQHTFGMVQAYLTQQPWYSSALSALAAKSDDEAAKSFCRRIRNSIAEVGLNDVDARIVAWAVIHGMPMSESVRDGIKDDPDCQETMRPIVDARAKKDALPSSGTNAERAHPLTPLGG